MLHLQVNIIWNTYRNSVGDKTLTSHVTYPGAQIGAATNLWGDKEVSHGLHKLFTLCL